MRTLNTSSVIDLNVCSRAMIVYAKNNGWFSISSILLLSLIVWWRACRSMSKVGHTGQKWRSRWSSSLLSYLVLNIDRRFMLSLLFHSLLLLFWIVGKLRFVLYIVPNNFSVNELTRIDLTDLERWVGGWISTTCHGVRLVTLFSKTTWLVLHHNLTLVNILTALQIFAYAMVQSSYISMLLIL